MVDRALDKWLRIGKDLNQPRCLVVFKPEEVLGTHYSLSDSEVTNMLDGPCRSGESKRLERQVQETSTLISDTVGAGIRSVEVARRTHQVSARTPAMYDSAVRPGLLSPMDDPLTRWRRRQTGCESAISNEDQKSNHTHYGLVLRGDRPVRSFLLCEPEFSIARCERHPVTIYGYEVDPFGSGVRPPDLLRSKSAGHRSHESVDCDTGLIDQSKRLSSWRDPGTGNYLGVVPRHHASPA